MSGAPGPETFYRADLAMPILTGFRRRLGRDLIAPGADPVETARMLWEAPFVVLSHDGAADPVLTYGNRAALELWQRPPGDASRGLAVGRRLQRSQAVG